MSDDDLDKYLPYIVIGVGLFVVLNIAAQWYLFF